MVVTDLKKWIYDNNKIPFILEKIGCDHIVYHPAKEYYSCSNCDGDNKAAINIRNNEYLNCKNYTREEYFNEHSDLLTLVQYNMSLNNKDFTFFDTVKYIHKILGLPLTIDTKQKKEKDKIDPLFIFKKVCGSSRKKVNIADFNIISETELQDFVPMVHIDFYKEGIMPWTIKKFGLAYSYRYKRNIIPLRYWLTGDLLGFNMRTSVKNYDLFDIKKYFITPGYPKQMNLFGLWENKKYILSAGYCVVFEAEKSVLKRDSLNDPTGVALSGHEISDEQVSILIGLNVEIIIALDKDIDINHVRHCCEKFYGIRKISYIYDSYDILGAKDSPADAKDKVFNFFMKFRKTYDENEHKEYLRSLERK